MPLLMSNIFDASFIEENRRPSGSGAGPRDPVHDSLVNMEVVPQTDPDTVSHKSRFHSSNSTIRAQRKRRASTVRLDTEELSDAAESDHHSMGPPTPPTTPPLVSSDPANESMEQSDDTSPTLMAPRVPPSPYDPTLTPSFRHSLPRLPLDQPWRFPSPTHPLHSRQRDLSLTMLAPETNSPTPGARGILETPFRNGSPMKPLGLGTPESMPKLRRALFTNSLSLTERLKEESEVEKALLPEALFSNLAPAPVTDSFPFNDWVATPGAPSSPLTKLMGPFDLVTSPLKLVSLLQDSAASADGEDDELQYPDSTPPLKKRRLTFDNYTTSPFNQS
ncbi:hypothetical protein C8J56DRAFT_309498 [Mycena floridula]|nr:hypothetical protein C8J56DRAFT_309498 [Mycena floridula]